MKTRGIRFLVMLAVLLSLPVYALPVGSSLEKDQVIITVSGKLFTSYKFAASQKYPYFWPVNGPATGTSITTETSEPYPHHHSLFFGCDKVAEAASCRPAADNGGNYWQEGNERGQILSQGPKIVEAEGDRAVFTDECLWKQPGQDPVMRDLRRVTVAAPDDSRRIIDFEIALEPLTDIRIEKTNHSLFSARVMPELSVASGGTLINAEGATAEKGTFGMKSPWCDYSGKRNGVTEGLAIFQNPNNRWYPAPWFTRDYGFFSPTPMYWLEGDVLKLAKGERLTLQYRIIVHSGDAKAAGIGDLFRQYANEQAPKH